MAAILRTPRASQAGPIYPGLDRGNARPRIFDDAADCTTFKLPLPEGLEQDPLRLTTCRLIRSHWHPVVQPKTDKAPARLDALSCRDARTASPLRYRRRSQHICGVRAICDRRFPSTRSRLHGTLLRWQAVSDKGGGRRGIPGSCQISRLTRESYHVTSRPSQDGLYGVAGRLAYQPNPTQPNRFLCAVLFCRCFLVCLGGIRRVSRRDSPVQVRRTRYTGKQKRPRCEMAWHATP